MAIRDAMQPIGEPHEVIVVDDASDDLTGSIAQEGGAHVIRVAHRQISATRNSGAREARGEILFFVDAVSRSRRPRSANKAALEAAAHKTTRYGRESTEITDERRSRRAAITEGTTITLGLGGTLDIGEDTGSAVDDAYVPPFRFAGGIRQVSVELKESGARPSASR